MQHKEFSVLEFSKTSSLIMVQCAFRLRYGIETLLAKNIRHWSKQFKETGCLYKGKIPGRPRTSERRVWDELSYRVVDVRTAGGGHIEHL